MGRVLDRLNRVLSPRLRHEIVPSRQRAHELMMLDHFRAGAEAAQSPVAPDFEARFRLLGRLLRPRRVTGYRKVRVGGLEDGGYVMLDDFTSLRTGFSLGVGPNVDWDYAMAERGIEVHQFDHTVGGPPRRHARFRFHKRRIEGEPSPDADDLASLMAAYGAAADRSNVLKVDIEGSEWALFAKAEADLLGRFPQILCEFHGLLNVDDEGHFGTMVAALRRLRERFEVVHVHGNNCGGRAFVAGMAVPDVLEVSFANKACYTFADETGTFPTDLDWPNNRGRPDYYLGVFALDAGSRESTAALERRAARSPDPAGFEPGAYLLANPDVAAAGHDAFAHWLRFGRAERRPLSPEERDFDAAAYLDANPDVAAAGFDALMHWRHFGRRDGRPLRASHPETGGATP